MHNLFRNLHYSVRMLRRNAGVTGAVVANTALGIGGSRSIIQLSMRTLLSPLPLPHPEQLVMVWSKIQGNRNGIAAGDFLDWQRYSKSFQTLCTAVYRWQLQSRNERQTGAGPGRLASPGFLRMQGFSFMLGRDFLAQESVPGNEKVVILTHKLWTKFGLDRNIVGTQLRINSTSYTVVGVLAEGIPDRYKRS